MRLDAMSKAFRVAATAEPQIRQLKQASKGVEAMFVKQLLGEMQKGTKFFGEGQAGSIYGDLFNDAIAKQVADRGAFGIADMMTRQGAKRIYAEAATRASISTSGTESKNQAPNDSTVGKSK